MRRVMTSFVLVLVNISGFDLAYAQTTSNLTMDVLYLDGTNSYVVLPPNIFDQVQEATIEVWVRWERFNKWSRVLDFGRKRNALLIGNEKTKSRINYRIFDKRGKKHGAEAKDVVTSNVWYHIAVVAGYGGMKFYVNGRLVDSDSYAGGLDVVAGGNNYIGKSNWPKDELFRGYICEFRVWKVRRSPTEIKSMMNRLLTGKEQGLVGYWSFNRIDGQTAPDDSPYNHYATLVGNASLKTVPAISQLMVPGELEKVAEEHYKAGKEAFETSNYRKATEEFTKAVAHVADYKDSKALAWKAHELANEAAASKFYASGQSKLEQALYRAAYDDFNSALNTIPGYKDASAKMQEALEKGRYRVALYPFKTSVYGANADLLYQTTLMDLMNNKSTFVEFVDQGTLNTLFANHGISLGVVDPIQTLNAARSSNIRAVIVGTILTASISKSSPERRAQTAFTVAEQEYYDGDKKKKRKVPTSRKTYYLITKQMQVSCEVNYKILDTVTGSVLKSDVLSQRDSDAVEYAEYTGDLRYLWVEQKQWPWSKKTNYVAIGNVERRFDARRDLKDGSIMMADATKLLAQEISNRAMDFLDSYSPPPMKASASQGGVIAKAPTRPSSQTAPTPVGYQSQVGASVLPRPSAVPTGYKKVNTLTGKGQKDTKSFLLSNGKVLMVARMWGSTAGSFTNITLKSEDGRRLSGANLTISTEASEEGRSDTTIRNITAGEYYVSIISGVHWEITMYQRAK